MNKAQAADLNADLAAAINAVLEKHGLDKGKQSLKWSESGEITLSVKAATAEAKKSNVAMFAKFVDVDPADIDKIFSLGGKRLQLADYNPRARKMPWVALEPSTGKRYKLTDDQVKRAFDNLKIAV